MKSLLAFLMGALGGALATLFFTTGILTGVGAGVGIATGLQAGICATAEAARSKGFVTAAQVDDLLVAASRELSGAQGADAPALSGGDTKCPEVMAKLKQANSKAE